MLTPDSSRFWDAATYAPDRRRRRSTSSSCATGSTTLDWDKTPPGPELPADVVDGTRLRYRQAFERITGISLDAYLAEDTIA